MIERTKGRRSYPKDAIKRIIVRTAKLVGDTLLTVPAIRAIRNHYREAHITVIAHPKSSKLLEICPYIDEIIVYDESEPLRRQWQFLKMVRAGRFDLAILLSSSFNAALIPFLGGVRFIAGDDGDLRGWMLTTKIHYDGKPYWTDYPQDAPSILPAKELMGNPKIRHLIRGKLALLEAMGIEADGEYPEFWTTDEDERFAGEFFASQGVRKEDTIVGLNPGSGTTRKRIWPIEHFIALGRALTRGGIKVAVFCGPREENTAGEIAKGIGKGTIVTPSETTIRQHGAMIRRCDAFVTGDTGPMHIAAALGVPTIGLFGPTHPAGTFPFHEGSLVISHYLPCSPCYGECIYAGTSDEIKCLKEIEPEEVLEGVGTALSPQRPLGHRRGS
ncbi:MAG: glycosyltransferase family 9 protein [bacterium]